MQKRAAYAALLVPQVPLHLGEYFFDTIVTEIIPTVRMRVNLSNLGLNSIRICHPSGV